MSDKVYIFQESEGEYDDYSEFVIAVLFGPEKLTQEDLHKLKIEWKNATKEQIDFTDWLVATKEGWRKAEYAEILDGEVKELIDIDNGIEKML